MSNDNPTIRRTIELIHEGKYAAEVAIDLICTDEIWSPAMSADDARKLETVRLALRRGDIAEAAKYGRVLELIRFWREAKAQYG
jgi:hypothetical protein